MTVEDLDAAAARARTDPRTAGMWAEEDRRWQKQQDLAAHRRRETEHREGLDRALSSVEIRVQDRGGSTISLEEHNQRLRATPMPETPAARRRRLQRRLLDLEERRETIGAEMVAIDQEARALAAEISGLEGRE